MNSILATLGLIASTPFLFFGANAQVAQNADRVDRQNNNDNTELVCTDLSHNLYWGVHDRDTDGEVSDLKAFLRAEGYLNGNNSGVFNGATMHAVMEFQGDSDIMATGFVGPQTRAEIKSISCDDGDTDSGELTITSIDGPTDLNQGEEGTWTVHVSGDELGDLHYSVKWGDEGWSPLRLLGASDDHEQASATFTHTYADNGTYTPEFTVTDEDGNEVTKDAPAVTVADEADALAIASIDPTSGPVGTKVTLEGEGYDGNTRVIIGGVRADADVEDDSTLTFTVPSLDEGEYRVVVRSDEGRSNAVSFTVTEEQDESVILSITGIDAPTRLEAGENGTWTVHVDSNVEGNLRYSADWGEDDGMLRLMASGAETVQSDATFTHAYREAGTYHPKFTVTDEDGNKTNVSASVVVTEEDND